MIYNDNIYGSCKIDEPVLLDIINSQPMQRLKGVNQYGPVVFLPSENKWSRFTTSRFEHSIGVCLLLREFNASLEEQISGLLHDIAHTAFSHVGDYFFNKHIAQTHHEDIMHDFVMNSELTPMLEKHGFDAEKVIKQRFSRVKTDYPDICADRIDFLLRDALIFGAISRDDINKILNSLAIHKNNFAFINAESAKMFGEKFMKMHANFWFSPYWAALFQVTVEMLNIAMDEKLITENDMLATDRQVFEKLKSSRNAGIERRLLLARNMSAVADKNNYDYHIKAKIRYADPLVMGSSISRLSELDNAYKKELSEFILRHSEGLFIRIIEE